MSEQAAEASGPKNAKLVTGSIRGHLVSQTLPLVAGVAALMSVGIIDAYFIGQLGSSELAAVAFIFPITTALSSLGVGVMAAIASVVSRALGKGDDERARALASLGMLLSLAIGLVIAISLYALRMPLFRLMQAEEQLLPLIDAYMVPFALSFPLLPAMMALNGTLRAQGAAKRSMIILLTSAVLNWILDPILIVGAFGFDGFGIAGAAYATIIAWGLTVAVAAYLLATTPIGISPRAIRHCDFRTDSLAIVRVAGPAAFSNSVNPAGLAILTAFLASAGPAAVAAFGAGGRIQAFAIVPLLGLSGSIGAIVGQNWGAERFDRARRALVEAGIFSIGYGLAIGAALVFFRESIASLFTEDEQVRQSLEHYLSISAWGYAGFGILIIANGALNAIDRATSALVQSILRVVLVMMPVAWLLRGAWGATAVYVAELSANLFGGALAVAVLLYVFRKARREREAPAAAN